MGTVLQTFGRSRERAAPPEIIWKVDLQPRRIDSNSRQSTLNRRIFPLATLVKAPYELCNGGFVTIGSRREAGRHGLGGGFRASTTSYC